MLIMWAVSEVSKFSPEKAERCRNDPRNLLTKKKNYYKKNPEDVQPVKSTPPTLVQQRALVPGVFPLTNLKNETSICHNIFLR